MKTPKLRTTLRKAAVIRALGYKASHFDQLVKQGVLPPPHKLRRDGKATGWWEDEIIAYQNELAKASEEQS